MDKAIKLDPIQPRFLRYRNHYKIYVLAFVLFTGLIGFYWSMRFFADHAFAWQDYTYEMAFTAMYFVFSGCFYFFWLRYKMNRSVQVFHDHLLVHHGKAKENVTYADIESLNVVCWSIFYVKMKSGIKHYFNSSLERVDYIWEGIHQARPDLMDQKEFDEYRVKLVQYDHHQKRKEWFFKHKLIDIFNWAVMPVMFITLAFLFQSKSIVIHQQGLYFFRLFMYAMLVLLSTAFIYSILLKKLVFDKKVSEQMEAQDKVRDLEFEGVILQRSKIFQLMTTCFVLALLVKFDVNLFSVSKVKEDIASFKLKKGNTILIDNRFNCVGCKYQLNDGDIIVFGRGILGQVLAKEGDMVGQISQDSKGRMIASENVQEVPKDHIAVKAANGKDIMFIRIDELIGRVQK